jgi:hypothetical protein
MAPTRLAGSGLAALTEHDPEYGSGELAFSCGETGGARAVRPTKGEKEFSSVCSETVVRIAWTETTT